MVFFFTGIFFTTLLGVYKEMENQLYYSPGLNNERATRLKQRDK